MSESSDTRPSHNPTAGAQFYKCAFQINPHHYAGTYRGQANAGDATSYAQALVAKADELGIKVLAVTDHNHVGGLRTIRAAAAERSIAVFPGFELSSNEGIHVLCLYPLDTSDEQMKLFLGAFGIETTEPSDTLSDRSFSEILARVRAQGGISIAAHVTNQKGLFKALDGAPCIRAWRDKNLHAIQIPGSVSGLPDHIRPIVQNRNQQYRRRHAPEPDLAIAVVNARDVASPDDLACPGATCWVKMSEVSIEGLRQAFLDPGSRIRLEDPKPDKHAELVEISWQGGFLDGVECQLNSNLNVLVGGRGAGKSTIIESLRYVLALDPLGKEARSNHEGIVGHALKGGTKVSLVVRSHLPAVRRYRIERTVPNPPVVRDVETGGVLNVEVADIFPGVEVYGQHEISELARSPQDLTRLLRRFMPQDESFGPRKRELAIELRRSRENILRTREELAELEDRLAALPGLEENQERYREAGIEEDLKEQGLLVREEKLLDTVDERLAPLREGQSELKRALPIDRRFLSPETLAELPNKDILAEADRALEKLSADLHEVAKALEKALDGAEEKLQHVRDQFSVRSASAQVAYEQKLRDLQQSGIDGGDFIRLRRKIETLRPLTERRHHLERQASELHDRRLNLLAEWEELNAAEFRSLQKASERVTRKLADRARVRVEFGGDREPLFTLLRDRIGGRLLETIDKLRDVARLSPIGLARACRQGAEGVEAEFGISGARAKRLAGASPETLLRIEEVTLPSTTDIELNVAPQGEPANWQALARLSTGQKATAVLLLLLLDADAPLVVDQPEDDLDNRFITEGIVPCMRDAKQRRQFVFSTHNANIPVLGDAELILGLTPSGEAEGASARIQPKHRGSIDVGPVRALVEELLEGGIEAFERRRRKYGF